MILEVAILDIGKGTCEDFEAAFRDASPIITLMRGYVSHELRRCVEKPSRYILLVKWQTLEAHTVGFRQSAISKTDGVDTPRKSTNSGLQTAWVCRVPTLRQLRS